MIETVCVYLTLEMDLQCKDNRKHTHTQIINSSDILFSENPISAGTYVNPCGLELLEFFLPRIKI